MSTYKKVNRYLGTNFNSNSEINWPNLSTGYTLPEEFIRDFRNRLDMILISAHQPLSDEFIREFKDDLSLPYLVSNQLLSPEFMNDYRDELNWEDVSYYQPYIDLEDPMINKEFIKHNRAFHAYQESKKNSGGWFIGYVSNLIFDHQKFKYFDFTLINSYCDRKVGIKWEDVTMLNRTRQFKLIRDSKYV